MKLFILMAIFSIHTLGSENNPQKRARTLLATIEEAYDKEPSDCGIVVQHIPFILLHASQVLKDEYHDLGELLEIKKECVAVLNSDVEIMKVNIEAMQVESIIYFNFNSSIILPEYEEYLRTRAEFLNKFPQNQIVIEGHADIEEAAVDDDEKDSVLDSGEVSISIGLQRAKAVKRFLTNIGVSSDNIDVVSYGVDKPLNKGHSESAKAKNRRASIIIY
jgi:peptidoglycan-associated lipoprotein